MPGTTARGSRTPATEPTPAAARPPQERPTPAPVVPTKDAPTEGTGYPVPYYNPRVPGERFYIGGSAHPVRFTAGRFVARNAAEEQAVRAALRRFGPAAADRWRGDDMKKEWASKAGDFRTRNENAKDDYDLYHRN